MKACDMPPQPEDDSPVNPNNPDGPTWGDVFGRSEKAKKLLNKPIDPAIFQKAKDRIENDEIVN